MADERFLYRVLGLSAGPRVLTFGFTLVAFPLMVRGVGAQEYGVFVYLTSLTSLLEMVAGLGVPSATGKALAEHRVSSPRDLKQVLGRWVRLQVTACTLSLVPAAFLVWIIYSFGSIGLSVPVALFGVVLSTMYFAVMLSFTRAALSSLLAFRHLAGLDTLESLLRSGGWLVAGLWLPTAWGLAWASLVTAAISLGAAFWLLRRAVCQQTQAAIPFQGKTTPIAAWQMLRESTAFMLLTLGTRTFQAVPVLIAGRVLGVEVVGIWGAMAKVVEILALPFTIVGNALMVRAPEIKSHGIDAIRRYWHMLSKLCVVAVAVALAFLLSSEQVASWMLPQSSNAGLLFQVCSALVLSRSISDLFAPASDYVGGLRARIIFLLACSAVQAPVIWISALAGGGLGCTVAMISSYATMVGGYIVIARTVFLAKERYRPPKVFWGGAVTVLLAAGATWSIENWLLRLMAYGTVACLAFMVTPALRKAFWPTKIIRYEFS